MPSAQPPQPVRGANAATVVGIEGEDDASLSPADASRMGKAAEHLIAAFCIMATRGALNVSTALVDDEAIDLVFPRRGSTATLAVQVKARMSDSKRVQSVSFYAFVRSQTFAPRDDLDMLFVAVDVDRGAVMKAWLVPSTTFAEFAGTTDKAGRYRFRASMKAQTNDRWRPYRLEANELPPAVLSRLDDLQAGSRLICSPPRAPVVGLYALDADRHQLRAARNIGGR